MKIFFSSAFLFVSLVFGQAIDIEKLKKDPV